MLVPTLPEARYLILDDADLSSLVAVALAAERWGGQGPAPVLVPSWWGSQADAAMPLVHGVLAQQARLYAAELWREELVVEPEEHEGGFPGLSDLLLAGVRLAARVGCDAVLFPVRAADLDGDMTVGTVAREVDRAALIARLASLDNPDAAPCRVVTPLIDFDDEQLIDLARDLSVPTECCWWSAAGDEPLAERAASRWQGVRAMPAGPGPGLRLPRTA